MPRRPSVNYWPSRKAYGCWHKGEQIILAAGPDDGPQGPTYLAALAKFQEVLSISSADRTRQQTKVGVLCEMFARHLESQGRRKTLQMFKETATSFVERHKETTIADLRPLHVQAWLDEMAQPRTVQVRGKERTRSWGATMRALALQKLKACFNWAQAQGYIDSHCLQARGAVRIPRAVGRGRSAYLLPEEVSALLGGAKPNLRDLLEFIDGTGCRPAEAYHVEARHYVRADGCFVLPWDAADGEWKHKTAEKTQRDRVIYLTPEMVALVEKRVAMFPTGPLFRNRAGRPWCNNAVAKALVKLARRVKITKDVTAYSFRHTFATRWLYEAGSIKVLAELMGNSVSVIERHYGHIDVERHRLRALLCKHMCPSAKGSAESPPSS